MFAAFADLRVGSAIIRKRADIVQRLTSIESGTHECHFTRSSEYMVAGAVWHALVSLSEVLGRIYSSRGINHFKEAGGVFGIQGR